MVAATLMATAPLPRPFPPPVIVIQAASADAVHAHWALDARTSICVAPPAGENAADADASVMTHSPAAWVTCARDPLTTIAPDRACGSGFEAAVNSTVPSPWPLAPDRMLNQPPSTVADQAHSRVAATPTVPDPPAAGTLVPPVFSVMAQRSADAGDVTVVLDEPHAATAIISGSHTAKQNRRWALIFAPRPGRIRSDAPIFKPRSISTRAVTNWCLYHRT